MYLSTTRKQLLEELRRRGEARAEELAQAMGVTVGGIRQQLVALQGDGLVSYRESVQGPGRPKHYYRLTPRAEELFPDMCRTSLARLVSFLDGRDPALLREFLSDEFARQRAENNIVPMDRSRPFEQQLETHVATLDRLGFMPALEPADADSYYLTMHHCPLWRMASGSRQVCEAAAEQLQEVIGEDVRRVEWRRDGAPVCRFRLRAAQGVDGSLPG